MFACPLCNYKTEKNLQRHLSLKHQLNSIEFYKLYPDYGPLDSIRRVTSDMYDKTEIACEYCNRVFPGKKSYAGHIARAHPEKRVLKIGHFECPICKIHTNCIKQHVAQTHSLDWELFVEQYAWQEGTHYFTEEHRKHLSENKKNYYRSEAGSKRKLIQSEQNSGENNPAKRPEVREKISKSRLNIAHNNFFSGSTGYGYSFWWKDSRGMHSTRSLEELKVLFVLDKYDIQYEYEPFAIKYFCKETNAFRNYFPDILVGNTLYEIKSSRSEFEIEKYSEVIEALAKSSYKLEYLDFEVAKKLFGKVLNIEISTFVATKVENKEMFINFNSYKGKKPKFLVNIFKERFEEFFHKKGVLYENKEDFRAA